MIKMKKINLNKFNNILFCGIGGSAMPGEIIKCLDIKKPVYLAREKFPSWANEKTLCFIISYSGNTKETLNLYKKAKKKNCNIIIITSNGKLSEKKEDKILIEKGYLPREALFLMLKPIFEILNLQYKDLGKIKKQTAKRKGKEIAEKIKNKHPVIYASSEKFKCIAYRWEDQLSENAKIFSKANYFPELVHNDIECKKKKNDEIIFLYDKKTEQIKKAEKILNPINIKLKGKTQIEKILYGIYIGDELSKELARLKKINYKKTPRIKFLKK